MGGYTNASLPHSAWHDNTRNDTSIMTKPNLRRIVATPTPHTEILLGCRKCGKKLDGGFGPANRDTLARALKRELRQAGRRTVRIVETKCLNLCPKGAVTVVAARTPGQMLSVPRGADPGATIATLLPPP